MLRTLVKLIVLVLALYTPALSTGVSGSDLAWGTYLGGTDWDSVEAVAVDASGYIYVAGTTKSSDFPTTAGAYDPDAGSDHNIFVCKLDPNGSRIIYSTFIGGDTISETTGEPWDECRGMAVDRNGNVYIIGCTGSANFPVTPGAYDTTTTGGFLLKLDHTGSTIVYSTFLGADPYAVAVDANGCAYVTGSATASGKATPGAYDTGTDACEAFVMKLNAAGATAEYFTYLGGTSCDYGKGIAVDQAGCAYVTGYTSSSDFPVTNNAYDKTINGGWDAFIVKLNPNGTGAVYSTYLGGSKDDISTAIALDSSGSVYITGTTNSPDLTTGSVFNGGASDAFVMKLTSAGCLSYLAYVGGTSEDAGSGIALDGSGSVVVIGSTESQDFPTTPGAYRTVYGGGIRDAFVVKLEQSGKETLYSSFIGGGNEDIGRAVTVDRDGSIYLTGETWSSDFPVSALALDDSYNGADSFAVKLNIKPTLNIGSWPAGAGTITPASDTYSYDNNELVSISAAPSPGYVFHHWEGDVENPKSPNATVLMNKNHTVTALFALSESSIGEISTLPDGSRVVLPAKPVTAGYNGEFYIEEPDRSMGIKVIWPTPPAAGTAARVSGQISTRGVERIVLADNVESGIRANVMPLFLTNRLIGGHLDAHPEIGFTDPTGMSSLYNLGLLIKTAGRITCTDTVNGVAYINDGSNLNDGNLLGPNASPVPGLRVVLPSGLNTPPVGTYAIMSGISGTAEVDGRFVRALFLRSEKDISLPAGAAISGRVTQGTKSTVNQVVESPHPYPDGSNLNWTVSGPANAEQIRVHFSKVHLEAGSDYLYLSDVDGSVYQTLSGSTASYDFWSAWLPGNTVKLRLSTDFALNRYGFKIDRFEVVIPGQPVRYAMVELLPESMTTMTDGNGYYRFDKLAGGVYTLQAMPSGMNYAPTYTSVTVTDYEYKPGVDFIKY